MIALYKVFNDGACEAAALSVLRSGQVASGPAVEQFRQGVGRMLGNERVVTTDNMSSAMTLALRLAGVGEGDEVLCSPFACMATNSPIAHAGARPVWVDIDPRSAVPMIDSALAAITPRSKAIIIYHFAGFPAWNEPLVQACRKRGIAVIEDCDNALGATVDGRPAGSLGDYAVLSFSPIRQLSCIEGGALVCRTEDDFQRALRLKRFGYHPVMFRDASGEINEAEDVAEIGWSAGLNNLCSAIGAAQLPTYAQRLAQARRHVAMLREALAGLAGIEPMHAQPGCEPAPWVLPLLAQRRDALLAWLKSNGIAASKMHYRNDRYSGFSAASRDLPGVSAFSARMLGIPCGWWLDPQQLQFIIERLHAFVAQGISEGDIHE
ncbi:DegT/DnrJ/EryC1/StrS family aminotransferase [Massilia sp. PAMC28688]|uniref:DegT/DnrJ/EryC1/StrS family aminotransferase n=1 Tax=Massilia sp. PAMC28688 TaxID=2861283 RepID=UPI001C62E429|nr:DegT/DnrJ/EryC1/StrS family aminotransferase [Massilia sp. PAMC28688]QYF91978.1 DegT/DnrJ/EryC1/StrS family aminotransferase [Massilia sp. PAMC28688]